MKLKFSMVQNTRGFTLIEVIVVLTVASVLFSMMFVYFSRSMLDSAVPVTNLVKSLDLTRTAERLTAHYRQDTTADLNILMNNLNANPRQYGTGFTVVTNQFIKFVGQNDTAISGADPENILKIKIRQNETNEALTLLFTRH